MRGLISCLPSYQQQANSPQKTITLCCWTDIKGKGVYFLCHAGRPSNVSLLPCVLTEAHVPEKHACIQSKKTKQTLSKVLIMCSHSPFQLPVTVPLTFGLLPQQHSDTLSLLRIRHSCLDLWSLSHPILLAPTDPTQRLLVWHLWKCTPVHFDAKISMMEVEPHKELKDKDAFMLV